MFPPEGILTEVSSFDLHYFKGWLHYDREFGSLIHDWILEESTPSSRAALCAEVLMRVEADPRVVLGSVRVSVLAWDAQGITLRCQWQFIDQDHPLNLMLQADKLTKQWIVADINPAASWQRALLPEMEL